MSCIWPIPVLSLVPAWRSPFPSVLLALGVAPKQKPRKPTWLICLSECTLTADTFDQVSPELEEILTILNFVEPRYFCFLRHLRANFGLHIFSLAAQLQNLLYHCIVGESFCCLCILVNQCLSFGPNTSEGCGDPVWSHCMPHLGHIYAMAIGIPDF